MSTPLSDKPEERKPDEKCWDARVDFRAVCEQQVIAGTEEEAERIAIECAQQRAGRSFIQSVTVFYARVSPHAPTPPLSEEDAPQKPMGDEWIKSFRLWTNPPIEKEAIEQGDKPYPPDPDAGYVRPHAEIHADLLKVNLENSELRRSMSDTANPGEPSTDERYNAPAYRKGDLLNTGEPSIEKLVDELESEVSRQALTDFSTRSPQLAAARAAVMGYVEELQKERDSAVRASDTDRRQIIPILEALDDVVPWEARCHGETTVQRIEYVKALLPTPEEAAELLWSIEGGIHQANDGLDFDALRAKLRRISRNAP